MKKWIVSFTLLLLALGCATTPQPVLLAGEMQRQASRVLEENVDAVIAAYTEELQQTAVDRYRLEFRQVESALQARESETGKVDLQMYKGYANQYAVEIQKAKDYYADVGQKLRDKLALQFAVSRHLADAIQRYNEETGLPPGTFDALVENTQALALDIMAVSESGEAIGASGVDVDWERVLEMIRAQGVDTDGPIRDFLDRFVGAVSGVGG